MGVPKNLEELRALRCEECGARMEVYLRDLVATYVKPMDSEAARALVFGIDVGFPRTEVVPVAYDTTVTCANGHETYLGRDAC